MFKFSTIFRSMCSINDKISSLNLKIRQCYSLGKYSDVGLDIGRRVS